MRKIWRQRSLTCGRLSLGGEPIPATLGGLAVVLIWLVAALPACPASYYPPRLEDPRAVYGGGGMVPVVSAEVRSRIQSQS